MKTTDAPLDAALAAIPVDLDPFERARLEAMLIAYAASWDDESVEVLGVEEEFVVPFVRPDGVEDPDWVLAGKIDLRVRWRGRVLVVDHKSAGEDISPGSMFRARLALNGQASQYMLASEALGWGAEAFVFDAVRKPNRRPGKTETPESFRDRCMEAIAEKPDEHLARIEVTRSAEELLDYRRGLLVDTTLIDTVRAYGLVSRSEGACFKWGGKPCEFHAACAGLASISDVSRFDHGAAHRELSPLRAEMSAKRRLLTHSSRQVFHECRQKYEWAVEQGIRGRTRSNALSFGEAMHLALQRYWERRQGHERESKPLAVTDMNASNDQGARTWPQ